MNRAGGSVLALCGGVGGAKLARGLDRVSGAALTVVVNTGDDFDHLGLRICPDLDTVTYSLAGLADPVRGWGRVDESWHFMAALAELGGERWFMLGDRDLAVHVERTRRLRDGETLSEVTSALAARLRIAARIVPMSDDPVRTIVRTAAGPLPFQVYFVRERCEPAVVGIDFDGAARATMSPAFAGALADDRCEAIVLCPSNPYLSIDPILAVPGVRAALERRRVPAIAVCPLIGGQAVKGPTAKIMRELGLESTAATIAAHYRGLIDALVVDEVDAGEVDALAAAAGIEVDATRTLMRDVGDAEALAGYVVALARRLARHRETR